MTASVGACGGPAPAIKRAEIVSRSMLPARVRIISVPPGEAPEYTAGVQAIESKDFARAVTLLEVAVQRTPDDADAWNWLAYATRRSGEPAKSIPLYQKALALDARHLGAHEYIGEAYLALDNLPKAKEHLARLNRLCLFSCEQYRDLKKAVESYEKSGGKVKPTASN